MILNRLKYQLTNNWIVAVLFLLSIFSINVLFHYYCYGGLYEQSWIEHPFGVLLFYLPKFTPAFLLASFVFLFRTNWWTICVLFLDSLWAIANLVYYRINGFLLELDLITMVGNMDGFWGSITPFLDWRVFTIMSVFLVYSLIYIYVCHNFKAKKNVLVFTILLVLSFVVVIPSSHYDYWKYSRETNEKKSDVGVSKADIKKLLIPFGDILVDWKTNFNWIIVPTYYYVRRSNITTYFPYMIIKSCLMHSFDNQITDDEKKEFDAYCHINTDANCAKPDKNLIIIIVESLESWLFENDKNPIMPNMKDFMNKYNVFYADKITKQTKYGSSGDGQMIINTGLLPLSTSAACMFYAGNRFPNYAENYMQSVTLNPCSETVWNQNKINTSYGYKSLKSMNNCKEDEPIFKSLNSAIDSLKGDDFCIQAITISMHSPFTNVDYTYSKNHFSEDQSAIYNYINMSNYTDSCFDIFLHRFEQDSLLRSNTVVVITGDHTIFQKQALIDFQPFAKKYNLPIPIEQTFVPLIIYSPDFSEDIIVTDTCYQMDIFPTVMHCIGINDYWWSGFGVNLLDNNARVNRKVTAEKASVLSDKIIRSNYFKDIYSH